MPDSQMRRREFLQLAAAIPAVAARARSQPEARASSDYVVIGGDPAAYSLVRRLMSPGAATITLVDESSSFRRFVDGVPEPPRPLGEAPPFVRGHRLCFDGWRDLGNPGWGFDDVLPYFKREEHHAAGPSEFRGGSGPLAASYCLDPHAAHRAFLVACAMSGFRSDARYDFNGPLPQGVAGYYQKNLVDDREQSALEAFLDPARTDAGVELRAVERVVGVIVEKGRAVGVEIIQNGRRNVVRATREVIVCADAARSAQLLLLSGIGPAAELTSRGIRVVADVPGVGANLQDHVTVPIRWHTTGALPESSVTAGMFTVSLAASPPDLQLDFVSTGGRQPSIGIDVTLVRPVSRGRVALASADPMAAPATNDASLSDDADLTALARGVRLARLIVGASVLDPWRGAETSDSAQRTSTPDLQQFVRRAATPRLYRAGTCHMGPETDRPAVVNASLQVRGVGGLRVAGAAVMPDIVNAPLLAATVMIGERCGDIMATGAPDAERV